MGASKPVTRGPTQTKHIITHNLTNKRKTFWRGCVMTGLYTPAKGSMNIKGSA